MSYKLKCTLCGLMGEQLGETFGVSKLVAMQEHAIVQHGLTPKDFQNSSSESFSGKQGQSIFYWTIPDGRVWLRAEKVSPAQILENEAVFAVAG